jgi:hypothetical protein
METIKYPSLSKKMLAERYEITLPTLNKWLNLVPNLENVKTTRIFTPKQVKLIIEHLE